MKNIPLWQETLYWKFPCSGTSNQDTLTQVGYSMKASFGQGGDKIKCTSPQILKCTESEIGHPVRHLQVFTNAIIKYYFNRMMKVNMKMCKEVEE